MLADSLVRHAHSEWRNLHLHGLNVCDACVDGATSLYKTYRRRIFLANFIAVCNCNIVQRLTFKLSLNRFCSLSHPTE